MSEEVEGGSTGERQEPIGRCAKHVGLHERNDQCRQFMSAAFAKALGLEPEVRAAAEKLFGPPHPEDLDDYEPGKPGGQ